MGRAAAVAKRVERRLSRAWRDATAAGLRVGSARLCPICQTTARRFQAGGQWRRKEARCVRCGSLERHRLLWLFVTTRTDLFDGRPKRMLHVAPERCLEPRFREHLGRSYLSEDLSSRGAMVRMDVMSIGHPDQTFDVIYCSHVLEHVADDRRAMRELHRVLRYDGWAILLVPIMGDLTFEDPSIVDPEDRFEAYGRHNHLRKYGKDYPDRLREAGFEVEETSVDDMVTSSEAIRFGLNTASGSIYYCTKR